MADKSAPPCLQDSPPLAASLLPADAAKKMSQAIKRLWWCFAIYLILEIVFRSLGMQLLTRFVEFLMGAVLLVSILSYFVLWQLLRRAGEFGKEDLSRWQSISLKIFVGTLLLSMAVLVTTVLLWVLRPLGMKLDWFFNYVIFSLMYLEEAENVGFIFGAAGILVLARSIQRQSAGKNLDRQYSMVFWITIFTLLISLVTSVIQSMHIRGQLGEPFGAAGNVIPWDSFLAYGRWSTLIPTIWCLVLLVPIRRRLLYIANGQLCPRCGYDLRGNLEHGCPECGWGREHNGIEDQEKPERSTGTIE